MKTKIGLTPVVFVILLALFAAACSRGPDPTSVILEKEVIGEKEVMVEVPVEAPTPTLEPQPRDFEDEVFSIEVGGDMKPLVVSQEVTLRTLDGKLHQAWMESVVEVKKSASNYERTTSTVIRILLVSLEESESVGQDNYVFLPVNFGISFAFDLFADNGSSGKTFIKATGGSFAVQLDREWSFSLIDYLLDPHQLDQGIYEKEVRNLAQQTLDIALNLDESDGSYSEGGKDRK